MITFDEFKKAELRVGKITAAERVEGSEKLIKLAVDVSTEVRQIVAGIGKRYTPEELIGRQIIIVANLAPRALMGIESHGMLLAANDENGLSLIAPDRDVALGAQVG